MSEYHIEINNLKKIYPGAAAPTVADISFALRRGEMLALLGPSGCGKTTLLRMIAGLLDISSGDVLIDGRNIATVPVHQRNIGMVFQAYALFPHMNIAENIAFGLEMRGVDKAERQRRVNKALDLVKLSGLGGRRVGQLSGGQQQRAAIARSLVIEPDLLLFDEPLSNLDAKLREELRGEIREIQRRTGVTAIFVTHDQDEALSVADRLAVMKSGRIVQIGSPSQVFDHPQSDFVARFIGSGNFFTARAGARPCTAAVEGLGELLLKSPAPAGSEIKLLIRPHRFTLATASESGTNRFTGQVEQVVYRGQVQSLTVMYGQQRLLADLFTHAGSMPARGDTVTLTVAPEDITLIGPAC